jgi:hypothetical protein
LFASADEPSLVDRTRQRVEKVIVKPLAASESGGSIFSRARPVPRERRVRVLQETATSDPSGRGFVPFSIDVRFRGGDWEADDIVGCAYVASGDVFVKHGDGYRPAAFLFGKDVDVAPGVCIAPKG